MSMTNMLTLYRQFEEITIRLADSMGYVMRAGFVVVIGLQVLLYGLWSGLVQMGKEERAKQKAIKKSKK
jgi:ATP/ADP translocase